MVCRDHASLVLITLAKGPRMSIDAPETEITDKTRIACDGGQGALGHPRVWLTIPADRGYVICGYCDKKFIHRDYVD